MIVVIVEAFLRVLLLAAGMHVSKWSVRDGDASAGVIIPFRAVEHSVARHNNLLLANGAGSQSQRTAGQ
jgi:hypothetical protein